MMLKTHNSYNTNTGLVPEQSHQVGSIQDSSLEQVNSLIDSGLDSISKSGCAKSQWDRVLRAVL